MIEEIMEDTKKWNGISEGRKATGNIND